MVHMFRVTSANTTMTTGSFTYRWVSLGALVHREVCWGALDPCELEVSNTCSKTTVGADDVLVPCEVCKLVHVFRVRSVYMLLTLLFGESHDKSSSGQLTGSCVADAVVNLVNVVGRLRCTWSV